ncbi:acyl-CoA dehydrogenase family protein [uncultured Hyphomonas sp.]|uniref:acyl-CoA dehydrogenase family protein n=1 Tax=uncultured Hyphomonas sp. TaxID=225298 RepID=UPI002AAB3C26|nr:acyl-CoA dehydrogenase family protein [uncultured Hyphomonas sp.]
MSGQTMKESVAPTLDKETIAQFRETVRRFTRERLVPIEEQVAESDEVPEEIIQEMRDLGLFGLTVPQEHGGLGLTSPEEIEIVTELCWASAAFRSLIGINLGVGSQGIVHEGTEAQKQEWLPRIATGEVITSFALTEPDSGSDAAALRTSAVRDGDTYILNGTKRYITNSPYASLITVMARTEPERLPGNRHVSAFLVPADTPGVTIGRKDRKMGQAGAWSADVILENVRVPATALLGGVEGRGFKTAMSVLDRGRLNVAAVCVGQAKRIQHEAVKYACERLQFGKPIVEFQLVQAMLADSQADILAAESLVQQTANRLAAGERVSLEASCVKMFASEMVGRVADRAVQVHGAAGYMRDSVVERFYRDVRVFRIYEGTTQIQQTIIGKTLARQFQAGDFA